MASHGVARTDVPLSKEQKQLNIERIKKYRDLELQIRSQISNQVYSTEVLQLTSKLLCLNPEYYTIWNIRAQCLLISSLSCKPSAGSSLSKELPSSSRIATTITCAAGSSSSSSTATRPSPAFQTTGRSVITVDGTARPATTTGVEAGDMQCNDLEILKSELGFTLPLLIEFPKCYWIWKYRSWLLQISIDLLDLADARRIWEEELGLDTKMLTKDRRNFHAWGYRRNIIKHLESTELDGGSLTEFEFEFTTKMIRVDLSNFSAWHNRSRLILRLLDERGADDVARKNFFEGELALIKEGLNVGPEDQSLWYYHQFLVLDLTEHVKRRTITAGLAVEERAGYISGEIADIKDLLADYDDSKLIYEALMEYTLALSKLEERKPSGDEMIELTGWLSKLRELDPMRKGRWNDVERELGVLAR